MYAEGYFATSVGSDRKRIEESGRIFRMCVSNDESER